MQRGLWALGYHVGRFPPVDSLSYHLKRVLSQLEIDCVIDVGAHEGEYARSLRDVGYTGQIISFEPVKATFGRLAAAFARDRRWRGFNVALGSEHGQRTMNIYEGSVFNSFLPPSEFGRTRFDDLARPMRTEVVEVWRLEDVLEEQLARTPASRIFLKMDTQGWDLEVLAGAGRRQEVIGALQTELSAKPIYDGMTGFSEALVHISKLGFELSGIFPVARDEHQLRVVELDCVMVRTSLARAAR